MHIAGDVGIGVAGEEVDLVALGTESKRVGPSAEGVALIEYQVTVGRDGGGVGKAILLRRAEVVGQEPSSDVYRGGVGIVELDGIAWGRIGMSRRFVDIDGRNV